MSSTTKLINNLKKNILFCQALLNIYECQKNNGFKKFKKQVNKLNLAIKVKKILELNGKYQLLQAILKWKLLLNEINMNKIPSPIKSTYFRRRKRISNRKKSSKVIPDPGKPTKVFLTHAWSQDTLGRDNHERVKCLK